MPHLRSSLLLSLVIAWSASAVVIIDTGQPPSQPVGAPEVSATQFLGAEFSLAGATTITGIEGFFAWRSDISLTTSITFAIYDESALGSDVPGVVSQNSIAVVRQ